MNLNIKFFNKEQVSNSSNQEQFGLAKFKGKFGDNFYDISNQTIYFGTEYSSENIMINDFAKANFYELGLDVKKLISDKITCLHIFNQDISNTDSTQFLHGVRQGEYKFMGDSEKTPTVLTFEFEKFIDSTLVEETEKLALGVKLSRNLLNMRADKLHPGNYFDILKSNFGEAPSWLKFRTVSKTEIDQLGMGWLAGVGKSSKYGYQIIALEIEPLETIKETVVLIGKGLTFDNGGVNIKVGGFSYGMHADMGGSAIVFGAAKALSQMARPKNTKYVFVSGVVENGLDANAMHPGDILENIVGQTVDVRNTDAEGRLTLGDVAPWTVINYQPTKLVTLATLTGHAVVAYTAQSAPIFANNRELQKSIYQAFVKTQEEAIATDLPKNVEKHIKDKSGMADVINTHNNKGGAGGAQAAAAFVMRTSQPKLWKKNRIENLPDFIAVAHVDVAGPVTDSNEMATGYGVRAMVEFCKEVDGK